ncbi:glucokinase [Psychromonas ossibalaenae]|uniref:glucokinase n=1 Tax=Psychromonas ossibalaenae TaxID=444922 RepID=UPI0003659090|nr:glucokinase [Psychromonas ossibalaenae]
MLSVVADVGGTNIRLAVCDLETGSLSKLREFACKEFITLDAALFQYFSTLQEPVKHLCVAIACPVEDDQVVMTNLKWEFSKQALKQKLQLESLFVINDYTAISLAVPFVDEADKIKIGGGEALPGGVTAVFGPGTGLGVSHIIKSNNKWISLDGEGGHVSFASNTREQADILLLLQEQFGHVSAERILSGQGLVNLYHSLCRLEGKQPEFHEPKQVTKAALDESCNLAVRSLTVFCQVMGSFAGNLALNLACYGGVYIAGGVVPRFVDFFLSSEFRSCFEEKGRFKDYLSSIPTYLITHSNPGLLGAAVYLRQELNN